MRSVLLAVGLLAFAGSGSGCATLVTGRSQEVSIRAEPEHAKIEVDGEAFTGAAALPLARGATHSVRVSAPGFAEKSFAIKGSMNPWVWGNLALLPLFWAGIFIDSLTGAVSSLSPRNLIVALDPLPSATSAPSPPAATARAAALPPGGSMAQWVIAVMELSEPSRTPGDAAIGSALTNQLRVFLAERGIRVVDRGAQERAVAAMLADEKARSYSPCVDASCQIPLGKALAASHILRTSIARFGSTCTTNGELIDLKTEVTIAANAVKSDCAEEQLLAAAETLARELIARPSH